jgi:hypothetical protein
VTSSFNVRTIASFGIDKEKKKKVNFQTGKIKVLFTIDLGTVQSGGTRFLSGIFFNEPYIVFLILLTGKPQKCPSSYQQCFLNWIIQ